MLTFGCCGAHSRYKCQTEVDNISELINDAEEEVEAERTSREDAERCKANVSICCSPRKDGVIRGNRGNTHHTAQSTSNTQPHSQCHLAFAVDSLQTGKPTAYSLPVLHPSSLSLASCRMIHSSDLSALGRSAGGAEDGGRGLLGSGAALRLAGEGVLAVLSLRARVAAALGAAGVGVGRPGGDRVGGDGAD
jgi:hypothetical protein